MEVQASKSLILFLFGLWCLDFSVMLAIIADRHTLQYVRRCLSSLFLVAFDLVGHVISGSVRSVGNGLFEFLVVNRRRGLGIGLEGVLVEVVEKDEEQRGCKHVDVNAGFCCRASRQWHDDGDEQDDEDELDLKRTTKRGYHQGQTFLARRKQ